MADRAQEIEKFFCPTQVLFGPESLKELSKWLTIFKIKKPFLVTGKSSALSNAYIKESLKAVFDQAVFFSEVPAGPKSDLVDFAHAKFKSSGCDGVVGLGGGSAIDVAKFVALLATNGGRCVDYEAGRAITQATVPVVAIPTTSGTGSEVTPYTVISNSETKRKFTVTNPALFPSLAIVDPRVTFDLPREQTLATGLDAFVHSLEAVLSAKQNLQVEPLAHAALQTIFENLPRALEQPKDESARTALSRAALLSGLVISHLRTGMIHTISVALDPYVEIPHGKLNAIITPYVLKFNRQSYPERSQRLVQNTLDWISSLGLPKGLKKEFSSYDLKEVMPKLIARIRQDAGLPLVNVRSFSDSDLEFILDEILRN